MKKRKLAGGTPGNGDVISAKGIYLDMQLGEATYSDICAEGRDSIKPRSVGLDRDGYSHEDRREAARVDATGKYEPKLTENGIPDEVLAKLLPGDDVIELSEPTIAGGIGYRFAKRAFDIVSCGCALILLAIPMGVIALKIKLESPGPVIYAQRRVGKNGKIFNVYKFRSMYVDAEKRGAQWAQGDDPRVTPFGKVMRKTRMDEIPQFWNVLKGDMSVVGPRPALSNEVATYNDYQRQRLLVKPGMTRYWQIRRNRDSITFDEWVDLGLWREVRSAVLSGPREAWGGRSGCNIML